VYTISLGFAYIVRYTGCGKKYPFQLNSSRNHTKNSIKEIT